MPEKGSDPFIADPFIGRRTRINAGLFVSFLYMPQDLRDQLRVLDDFGVFFAIAANN